MEAEELSELESLKIRCLKKDGIPKKNASQNELSRISELQVKYDSEHTFEIPKGVSIAAQMKEVVVTIGGVPQMKTVPADFQNKK